MPSQLLGIHHPWLGMNRLSISVKFSEYRLEVLILLYFYSFIENFGTHVVTSVTIGGKDVIYIKQHHSSPLSTMEIKNYVQDIGNQRFSDKESHTSSGQIKLKDKASSTISIGCLSSFICFAFLTIADLT